MHTRLAAVAVGAALLLSGCSSTNYFTIKDISEEAVADLSFAAPTPDMDDLRARYIVAGIALYGVHSVNEYSGEYRTADASRILNRTVELLSLQDEFRTASTNRYFRQTVRRIETLTLVDAAVQPTKRYYREKLLGLFAGGPGAAVAAAETAFDALKGLATVEVYRQAMLADARLHAIEIAARTYGSSVLAARPPSAADTTAIPASAVVPPAAAISRTLEAEIGAIRGGTSCSVRSGAVTAGLTDQLKADAEGPFLWWDYLGRDAVRLICENKPMPAAQRVYLSRAYAASQTRGGNSADQFAKDLQRPNELVLMACEELTRLAGLREAQDPCKKYFAEKKAAAQQAAPQRPS